MRGVIHIDSGLPDYFTVYSDGGRCYTTGPWLETRHDICFMDVNMPDNEPTPFMVESQRKQKAYEASRRKWKEDHPDLTRDELDAMEAARPPRQTD